MMSFGERMCRQPVPWEIAGSATLGSGMSSNLQICQQSNKRSGASIVRHHSPLHTIITYTSLVDQVKWFRDCANRDRFAKRSRSLKQNSIEQLSLSGECRTSGLNLPLRLMHLAAQPMPIGRLSCIRVWRKTVCRRTLLFEKLRAVAFLA